MTHRDTNVAHGGTTAPRTGGQQTDEGNRQQGGQPGDDQRGGEGNRQEGNKDKPRGGGDERQQQLRNHGQEGGKTARNDNE